MFRPFFTTSLLWGAVREKQPSNENVSRLVLGIFSAGEAGQLPCYSLVFLFSFLLLLLFFFFKKKRRAQQELCYRIIRRRERDERTQDKLRFLFHEEEGKVANSIAPHQTPAGALYLLSPIQLLTVAVVVVCI